MSVGYAITNALTGLASSAFTLNGMSISALSRLNDGVMDEIADAGGGSSGQYLRIDMGSATALVGFALLNHNLATGGCTVEVKGADDSGFTTNVVTAKAASTINTSAPYQKDTVLQFPSVSRRYWKLTFTHSGSKTISLGEVLAFTSITTLTRTPMYGAAQQERYLLNRSETRTGHVRTTLLGGPLRDMTLPFKDLEGTSQRDELLNMWRATYGGTLNLLWLDYIESTATAASSTAMQCLWGRLQESLGWSEDDYNLWGVDGLRLVGLGREVGS